MASTLNDFIIFLFSFNNLWLHFTLQFNNLFHLTASPSWSRGQEDIQCFQIQRSAIHREEQQTARNYQAEFGHCHHLPEPPVTRDVGHSIRARFARREWDSHSTCANNRAWISRSGVHLLSSHYLTDNICIIVG